MLLGNKDRKNRARALNKLKEISIFDNKTLNCVIGSLIKDKHMNIRKYKLNKEISRRICFISDNKESIEEYKEEMVNNTLSLISLKKGYKAKEYKLLAKEFELIKVIVKSSNENMKELKRLAYENQKNKMIHLENKKANERMKKELQESNENHRKLNKDLMDFDYNKTRLKENANNKEIRL